MDWREPVFDYCERVAVGLWAEPLNAFSNVAFLVAAVAALLVWRQCRPADRAALLLILLTAAIGAGSFIFHTVATRGAMLLDVVPIALFIYLYFLTACRRFLRLGLLQATGATMLFALGSQLASSNEALNGSLAYLPALCALVVFSATLSLRSRRLPAASSLALAAGKLRAASIIFAVSLGFRTLDRAVCESFPLGVHFVWHVLNAVTLWLLTGAALLTGEAGKQAGPDSCSRKPEPESKKSDRRVGNHDRPDIPGQEIDGGPGDAAEKAVDEQDRIAIGKMHERED